MKKVYIQDTPFSSPWNFKQRFMILLWECLWSLACSWTPKPANNWRLMWLKIFGAKIYGKPFVHQRARIQIPWNLILHDRACLGDRANAYSLGKIEIFEFATVAQEVYLCTGTHAFNLPANNLITAPIIIGAYSFIGARSFILPGVNIGEKAVIGACSVVTRDVSPYVTVVGNPARAMSVKL